ncbi:MAG: hypothetical protein HOW73_36505 [Polyangiaceae bacterium]|nr:hypothetical protein [Polyangiaceae bacterium]
MPQEESMAHCTTCGLPLVEPTCRGCGGTSAPLGLADGIASAASAFAADPGGPELELAHEAWRSGDYARLVSHCLTAEGFPDASSAPLQLHHAAEGPVFKAIVRGLATFLRVRTQAGELVIEAPLVRLPLTQYIPALRLLLELSDGDASPARFSVRGDLVFARYVGKLATLPPAALCACVSSVLSAANDAARLLVGALQAREISPDEHAAMSIDAVPPSIALNADVSTSSPPPPPRRQQGGMFDAMESLVEPGPPSGVADMPPILIPAGGVHVQPPQRGKVPTPARIGRPTPGFIASGTGAPARAARTPAGPLSPPTAPIPQTTPIPHAPPPAPAAPARGLVPPPKAPPAAASVPPGPIGRTMVSADGAATTEPSAGVAPPAGMVAPRMTPAADPLGDTFIGHGQPGGAPPKTGSVADGLCELLHKAQTLGAVLSFADQPATMCLLIRATVYRAIQEHESAASKAVAFLYHSTVPMTREIYITAPGVRRGSMAIPPTSPAFEVMARIVAQRGEVDAADPLTIVPITTAQEAKQHLARYVSEIDQAPSDSDLRHFLAIGALSELLVRTKLPAATQERLRGIVQHARKEGPKQQVVDLMMTALTRMIA